MLTKLQASKSKSNLKKQSLSNTFNQAHKTISNQNPVFARQ